MWSIFLFQDYAKTGLDVWDNKESSDDVELASDFSGFYNDDGRLTFTGFRKCIECYTEFNSWVPRCKNCWKVLGGYHPLGGSTIL